MNKEVLYKYISGKASIEEQNAVVNWVNQSDENMRELMIIRRLYDAELWYPSLKKSVELDENEVFVNCNSKELSKKSQRKRKNIWVVAIKELLKVAAVFLLAFIFFNKSNFQRQESKLQAIYTPAGQRAELTLEDGTKVWLNSRSKIIYPTSFNKKERRVKVVGEAYFKVAKKQKKPFYVDVENYRIKVLGTEFNVQAFPEDSIFETSLIEGSVELTSNETKKIFQMVPGMKVSSDKTGLVISKFDSNDAFLWREGIIFFDGVLKDEFITKIKRYFDVDVIVNTTALDDMCLSGKFRISDGVDHIFNTLKLKYNFNYIHNMDLNNVEVN